MFKLLKVRVYIDYDENLNEAQIDAVSLTKEYYGQNFAYNSAIPATAIPSFDGSIAIPRSKEQAKTKTQTLDVAPALPGKENDLAMYRYGGADPSNLFPSERDVEEGDGLSFSTVPKDGAAMTTMGAVNATGILMAVHDKPKHVSVKPRFASLAIWRAMGVTSPFTLALKKVLTTYRGR